jgi:Amidohydrolase family
MRPPDAIHSAVLRIRGFALPDGGPVDLYADGDRWTTDPVANAELVAEGWVLPGLVLTATRTRVTAAEAGVTILAGTDSRPHGRVADEVRALVSAGLSPHQAIGAASWAARSYLGLDGLTEGAPADAVIYDADPRRDLSQLAAPRAVVLRGQLRYRRT